MYEMTTLTNGLRVATSRLAERDSVAVGIWAKVGGRYEAKRLSGISHYLEHMLFKGTKTRSLRKIKSDVEGVGGMMNAFTGEESTCYFVKILKEHGDKAFEVLSDMVNHALLSEKEHEKERTVILEEIKMYVDQPAHHVHELLSELMWPNQPLGRPLAGTYESVSRLTASHLRSHRDRHYHPQNLLVVFCGDVLHHKVCGMADDYFGHRKSKPVSGFPSVVTRQTKPRFWFVNKKTEQMHFVIGFHGLPRTHSDRYVLAVLNILLGANMSSRLFEEVREKRGLAYEIRSGINFFEDAGGVSISAGLEPKKARLALHVIMRELKRLKNRFVSSIELQRAKDYFLGQFFLGMEDTLDQMLWVGDRTLYGHQLPDKNLIRRHVEAVTSDEIRKLSQKIFRTQKLNFTLIGPYGKGFESSIKNECDCA